MIMLRLALVFALTIVLTASADAERPAGTDSHGDALPPFVRARLGTLRLRHGGAVQALRFLADSQTVLAVGSDGTLRVWDVATGKEKDAFKPPREDGIDAYWAAAPDGRTAVASSFRDEVGVLTLWQLASRKPLVTLKPAAGQQIATWVYSPDGKTLALLINDEAKGYSIRLVATATGQDLRTIVFAPKQDQEGLHWDYLAFTNEGKTVTARESQTNNKRSILRRWVWQTGEEVHIPPAIWQLPRGQRHFSPDGKTLLVLNPIAGSKKKQQDSPLARIQLWDQEAGKLMHNLGEPVSATDPIEFHYAPKGLVVAALNRNGSQARPLQLWDKETGKALPDPDIEADTSADTLTFAPDGQTFALATQTGFIYLCETLTGKRLHRWYGYDQGGNQSDDPEGGLVLGYGHRLTFSPDGKRLAAAGTGGLVRFWNVADGKEWQPVRSGHEGAVNALALSPDGKTLATAGGDRTVRIWDLATGKQTRSLLGPEAPNDFPELLMMATAVAFAPDGQTLATGWADGTLQLWDLATGKEIRQYQGHEGPLTALAFTPNGKALLSAGEDGKVFRFDVATGKEIRQFAGQQPLDPAAAQINNLIPPQRLALSPDGRLLATGGMLPNNAANQIQVWELATGQLRRRVQAAEQRSPQLGAGLGGGIGGAGGNPFGLMAPDGLLANHRLAFSPDSKTLATAGEHSVRLWNLADGKEIRQFGGPLQSIQGLAFSPDGKLLATANGNGGIRLWDAATGTVLTDLRGHRGQPTDLVFLPDGRTLASSGSDTTVLLWDVAQALAAAQAQPQPLADGKVQELWQALAGESAEQADQAMQQLVAHPEPAVRLLQGQLRPIAKVDGARIKRLLGDLENDSFEVRVQATEALAKLGELAEPYLQQRLAGKPSLEVRQRLEQLLDKLQGGKLTPAEAQVLRAVEVLERIGTAPAKAVLRELAQGAAEAHLTQEAQAALRRLR